MVLWRKGELFTPGCRETSNFENMTREGTADQIQIGKQAWSRDFKCEKENVNSSQSFLGDPQKY